MLWLKTKSPLYQRRDRKKHPGLETAWGVEEPPSEERRGCYHLVLSFLDHAKGSLSKGHTVQPALASGERGLRGSSQKTGVKSMSSSPREGKRGPLGPASRPGGRERALLPGLQGQRARPELPAPCRSVPSISLFQKHNQHPAKTAF